MRRLLLAALLLLTACAGPRNGLNTPASTCFRGLPEAAAAAGHKGSLVGVRRLHTTVLARTFPPAGSLPPGAVCVVAYRGAFVAGDVPGADPPGPGAYAIVVLDDRGARVLTSAVLDRLPIRFQHNV